MVDVGVVPGGPARRPLLEDASPFRLIRFQPPGPGGTLSLGLELQVREETNGTVVVSSVPGLSLEAGSNVALYDLTPALPADPEAEPTAPIAGPSTTVCDPDAAWELDPMPAGEEMMVVVGPGGLDAGVGRDDSRSSSTVPWSTWPTRPSTRWRRWSTSVRWTTARSRAPPATRGRFR